MSIPCRSLHDKFCNAGGAGRTHAEVHRASLQPLHRARCFSSPALPVARRCLTRAVPPWALAVAPEAILAGGWQAQDACVTTRCIISV